MLKQSFVYIKYYIVKILFKKINWLVYSQGCSRYQFIYILFFIYDLENFTEYLTVDEEAHEFVAELKEPGKYKLSVTTFSSSGSCETRNSQSAKSLSFYISKYQRDYFALTEELEQWSWCDEWCLSINYSSNLRDPENSSRSWEAQIHVIFDSRENICMFHSSKFTPGFNLRIFFLLLR